MPVSTISPAPHIDVYHSIFTNVEVIWDTECRRNLNGPVSRFECCVTVKYFKTELHCFVRRQLFRTAEEFTAQWIDTADVRRSWCPPLLNRCCAHSRQNQEQLFTLNGIITFDNALIVGIPPTALFKGYITPACAPISIAFVLRKTEAPAIWSIEPLRSS